MFRLIAKNFIERKNKIMDNNNHNINDEEVQMNDDEPSEEDISSAVGNVLNVMKQHEFENAEITKLKKEKETLESKISLYGREINRLRTELTRCKGSSSDEISSLNGKIATLNIEITKLQGELKRREDEIQHLNSITQSSFLHHLSTGKLFIIGSGVVVALAVLVWMFASVTSLFQVNDITNIDVIITAVEACGEVTTHRAYFESVADRKEDGWFGRWRQFVIIFGGTVDCGFDMQKAKIDIFEGKNENNNNNNEKKRKIIVTLPHCKVLRIHVDLENNNETDKKSIRIYDQKGGLFSSSLTLEEQNEVVSEALKQIRKKAVSDWNVLQAAEKNAIELYEKFLKPFNCEVIVRFTDNEQELAAPLGNNVRTSKSGGILVLHDEHDDTQENNIN